MVGMSRRPSVARRCRGLRLLPVFVISAMLAGCSVAPAITRDFDPVADPVIRTLRAIDRPAFDDLVRRTADAGDVEERTLRLQAHLRTGVVPKYIPLASDEAIRDYVRVTIAELHELRDASYYRCFSFLFGERTDEAEQVRLERTLSSSTRAAGFGAIARFVESAEPVPVSIDEEAAWRVLDNHVLPVLPAWLGERKMVLRDTLSRDIDRVAACEVTLAVYEAIVDLPPPDGPLVMRYMLTRQVMAGL